MRHKHTSPFEHSIFTFYIKTPLFVRSEWHRHRTWSYNEISGRYAEFADEFYIPREARVPHATNRQGSQDSRDQMLDYEVWQRIEHHSRESYQLYRSLLDHGLAREMARIVLPTNLYTQFYGTVDAHNLMHFLRLRTSEDAQWEIRQYAYALRDILAEKMPLTYEAFEENGGPSGD
jgi:thymidylate synthase (FAD)